MKLYFRFLIPITLVLIISLIFINGLFLSSSNKALIDTSHERLDENIFIVESNLTTFIDDYFSFGKQLASDELIRNFLTNYDLTDAKSVNNVPIDNTYMRRGDELGNLTKAFHNMTQKISEDFSQLDASKNVLTHQLDKVSKQKAYIEFIDNYDALTSLPNRNHFFDTKMNEQVHRRRSIETILKEATHHDSFLMNYQPQVNLVTGEIIAYESLIRSKSAAFPPGDFIPIAESSGQIIDIGRWVTQEVIRQIGEWQQKGYPVKPVSINFSAYQLYDSDYLDILKNALKEHNVKASLLEIEITESIYIKNIDRTSRFLNIFDEMGIKISIDDFGTGYSSLNYLTYMPLSKLKIDSSLSHKFLGDSDNTVIKSIIALSHSLDLIVVAEGIEELDDIMKLRAANCDIVQGYYYSRPLSPEAVTESFHKIYEH